MLIDGHCHLADPRIESALPRIMEEAHRAGIGCFVQGGVDPQDWGRQERLKAKFPGQIVTAYGLHPWWVAAHPQVEVEEGLVELSRMIVNADALGELGLDFASKIDSSTHGQQLWAFERQLELRGSSPKLQAKPLVLHVVRAHEPALRLLRAQKSQEFSGLVHSFSANREVAARYLDLGLSLSISGVVTRKGFETLRRTVRYIPDDRLIVETDAPDQSPDGWKGEWNEPSSLLRTAQVLAEIRGVEPRKLLERSAENLRRVFVTIGASARSDCDE